MDCQVIYIEHKCYFTTFTAKKYFQYPTKIFLSKKHLSLNYWLRHRNVELKGGNSLVLRSSNHINEYMFYRCGVAERKTHRLLKNLTILY